MNIKSTVSAAIVLVALMAGTASADVVIEWTPQHALVNIGESVDVQITATFTEPIMAWGLDLEIEDPGVVSLAEIILGDEWDATDTIDEDGLAGMTFPVGNVGEVVLATLTFQATDTLGSTPLALFGGTDEDEGFLTELNGLDCNVTLHPGLVEVVPEPSTFGLVALAGLALLRRR